MSFRKILCPIDFSAGSSHALRVAARLSIRDGAELVLAHAWDAGEYALAGYTFPPRAVEQMIADQSRGLTDAIQAGHHLGAERVTSRLLTGQPWQQIVETLQADPTFDLVVMGTRGRTGLSRVLLGSVAEKVVRHAPCPVLTTREDTAVSAFRRVLCPVDFSDSAREASALAARLVESGGTAITLMYVIDMPPTYSGDVTPTGIDLLEKDAARQLGELAAEVQKSVEVSVATTICIGNPGAEILRTLDEQPAFDLVVMGSHGRTGIRRALLGSVAEKIVRHAPCPVAVARSRMPAA